MDKRGSAQFAPEPHPPGPLWRGEGHHLHGALSCFRRIVLDDGGLANGRRRHLIELLLMVAIELEHLSGLGGSGDGTIQFGSNTGDAGDEFGVAARQLSLAVIDVVFEADAYVAAHRSEEHTS